MILVTILKTDAPAYTLAELTDQIEEKFGVRIEKKTLDNAMRKLGIKRLTTPRGASSCADHPFNRATAK